VPKRWTRGCKGKKTKKKRKKLDENSIFGHVYVNIGPGNVRLPRDVEGKKRKKEKKA
jgi:hypothetical protein